MYCYGSTIKCSILFISRMTKWLIFQILSQLRLHDCLQTLLSTVHKIICLYTHTDSVRSIFSLPISMYTMFVCMVDARAEDMKSNAQYTILLPGKALHLTPLNNARKFRNRGNKEGGYKAFKYLAHLNLGRIEEYMVPGQKVKVSVSEVFNLNIACQNIINSISSIYQSRIKC